MTDIVRESSVRKPRLEAIVEKSGLGKLVEGAKVACTGKGLQY